MRLIFSDYHMYRRQVRFRGGADNEWLTSEVNSGQVEIGLINHYHCNRLRAGLGARATHVTTQAGPPQKVYSAPSDPWTAGFPGTANLLPEVPRNRRVQTALGWHEMRAGGQLLDAGGRVTVLIRPEQMTLAPFTHSPGGVTGTWSEGSCRPCG